MTQPGARGKALWAFVGPTGVGKTTTLAKLAAHFSLKEAKKVSLVTVDTYRIGAVDQLKTYGRLLGLPVRVVGHPEELKPLVEGLEEDELALIDTAGSSPQNREMLQELKDFLTVSPVIGSHLVVSATTKERDLGRIIDRFGCLPLESYVCTKLDETEVLMPLFNQLVPQRRPLSYLTCGQRVPEDLEPATKGPDRPVDHRSNTLELTRKRRMDQAEGLRTIMSGRKVPPGSPGGNGGERRSRQVAGQNPLVLSIASGKGGVGKTNIVANLGLALARSGKRVLVLDADLGLANIDIVLGLTPRYTLEHFLAGRKKLQDILIPGPEGMLILPASSGVPELVDLNETQKICLLNEMDQLSQRIDWLLIDTGAGISTNVLYFNLAAQESIIVVTPEPTSITDAYALIKILATRHQKKNFLILVNAAAGEGEAREVFRKISLVADRFLSSVSLDYLGFIPFDKHIPAAVRRQQALLEIFPQSPAGKSFADLSRLLLDRPFRNRNEGNVQFFWKQVWQVSNINLIG